LVTLGSRDPQRLEAAGDHWGAAAVSGPRETTEKKTVSSVLASNELNEVLIGMTGELRETEILMDTNALVDIIDIIDVAIRQISLSYEGP
jgi:hypothetical protein